MKINVINNSVSNKPSTMNQSHNMHENTLIKTASLDNSMIKESPAVKISISLEGKQKYRESLGDKNQSESYESAVNQINQLLQQSPKIVKGDLSYRSEISEKMQSMGGGQTTVEKASNLLKAYASLYDEIMQGKNDDNEDYISGQVNALNDALKYHVNYLENTNRLAPVYASSLERYANNLSRWAKKLENSMAVDDMESKARSVALRLKNDIVPENLSKKIMTASKLFVEQYSMQKDGSIDNILEKIFPTAKNKESM